MVKSGSGNSSTGIDLNKIHELPKPLYVHDKERVIAFDEEGEFLIRALGAVSTQDLDGSVGFQINHGVTVGTIFTIFQTLDEVKYCNFTDLTSISSFEFEGKTIVVVDVDTESA